MANELEFQGDVIKWMSADIKARPHLGIGDVGQEKQYADQKRSDLVIWHTRDVDALGAVELKTLSTPLSDINFQDDVIKKARRVGAPYCVQWNQRQTAIHSTPKAPPNAQSIKEIFADPPLSSFSELTLVTSKDYVGKPAMGAALQGRARDILARLPREPPVRRDCQPLPVVGAAPRSQVCAGGSVHLGLAGSCSGHGGRAMRVCRVTEPPPIPARRASR